NTACFEKIFVIYSASTGSINQWCNIYVCVLSVIKTMQCNA
ncbi:23499_t:CDS:1, partial [Racocetra persica]